MTQGAETATHHAAAPGRAASLRRLSAWDFAALALVAVIGLIHLPHPFEWDQATFVLGARRLAEGGVLYRDFWDVKQPAIYAFFFAGGKMFGFHEAGIHFLELLWQVAFAAVLLVTLKPRLSPGAAALLPLLTVGLTWAASGPWHLTQVELLVGFPLYLVLFFALRAGDSDGRARHAFLSGLCAAVVAMFKLVLLPVVAAIWLVALFEAWRARRPVGELVGEYVVPALGGLLLPWAAGLVMWWHAGLLPTLRWTWFEFPARMMRAAGGGTRINALFDGLQWFGLRFGPAIGFALPGLASGMPERRLRAMLGAWVLAGLGVVWMQKVSWWQYHYLLVAPPIGILAAEGIASVYGVFARGASSAARRGMALGIAATFAGAIALLGMKTVLLVRDHLALDAVHRRTYQIRTSQLYDRVWGEIAFLKEPGALPGPILVLDNPAYYWLSGRRSARRHDGVLFVDRQTPEEWRALVDDVTPANPAYVFVETPYLSLVENRAGPGAAFTEWLAAGYREAKRSALGVWYERRTP